MKGRMLVTLAVGILTVMVVLTLLPLILMFYTSFKPTGTLFQSTTEVRVADFEIGEMNSIGGPIAVKAEEGAASVVTMEFQPAQAAPQQNRVMAVHYQVVDRPVRWTTRVGQDMRKFAALELKVRGEAGGESFQIELSDLKGRRTGVPLQVLRRGGLTTQWETIRIPMEAFRLSSLTPGVSERVAEELEITFTGGTGTVYLDDIRFLFRGWTLNNYWDVLVSGPFGRYFWNSAWIAVVVTLANLIFSTMTGYAFARRDFPFKKLIFLSIIGSIAIPPQVLMVPVFILMKHLGWLNTYSALIVPNLVMPFNVFLMRQYITKLPIAVEEAARIDGASEFDIFWRVIVPLSQPALAVVGINTFMGSWNTFLYPFLLTNTVEMRTLPVGLALYKSLHGVDWVHLMAGSAITALPVIVVFLCFQRHIIEGLTRGSTVG
ncbi:MAG: carbohydrate ABC transporter permease [Candidatus Omnitrophica bacterium]|nr:carbohydrate ABC transporter permease [Candidatus Omnitrophota bacterium]